MGDTQVNEVYKQNHLGIILSSDFSWNNHIKMFQDNALKRLEELRRHKFNLDIRSLSKLYITLFDPCLSTVM